MKLFLASGILLAMATMSLRGSEVNVAALARDPAVARSTEWLAHNLAWITEQQIHLNEIPAPEFSESKRGAALRKLFDACGLKTHVDVIGNVIGERVGSHPDDAILLAAHLDTVFPAGTDVRVKRNGSRLEAPGIADNGAGLAALVAIARALEEGHIRNGMTILFAGDVGEEGEGNLRGIRVLVETYKARLRAVIAIDGAAIDYITTQGLASRRIEAVVTGPGGHSWSDFGAPNPITAISRGIVKFSAISVPDSPRTSFNFGVIEGGTSVNSIPNRAAVKVDLRSEDDAQLVRLEAALRDAIQTGANEEMGAQRGANQLEATFRSLGVRP